MTFRQKPSPSRSALIGGWGLVKIRSPGTLAQSQSRSPEPHSILDLCRFSPGLPSWTYLQAWMSSTSLPPWKTEAYRLRAQRKSLHFPLTTPGCFITWNLMFYFSKSGCRDFENSSTPLQLNSTLSQHCGCRLPSSLARGLEAEFVSPQRLGRGCLRGSFCHTSKTCLAPDKRRRKEGAPGSQASLCSFQNSSGS